MKGILFLFRHYFNWDIDVNMNIINKHYFHTIDFKIQYD